MNGQQFYLPAGKTVFPIIGVRASYDDPMFSDDRMVTTFIESGKISPVTGKGGLCTSDFMPFQTYVNENFKTVTLNNITYQSASVLIELATDTFLSEDGSSYDYKQSVRVVVFGNYTAPNNAKQSDSLYDKIVHLPHQIKPGQKYIGSNTISWQDDVDDSLGNQEQRKCNIWNVYNKNNPNNMFRLINVQFNATKTSITIGPNATFDDLSPTIEHLVNLEDLTVAYAVVDTGIILNKMVTKLDRLEGQVESLIGTTLGKYVAR